MSDGAGLLVEVANSLDSVSIESSTVAVEPDSIVTANIVGTTVSVTGSATELNCWRALAIKAMPPAPKSTINPIISKFPGCVELGCLIVKSPFVVLYYMFTL